LAKRCSFLVDVPLPALAAQVTKAKKIDNPAPVAKQAPHRRNRLRQPNRTTTRYPSDFLVGARLSRADKFCDGYARPSRNRNDEFH
jgi:hypothetical protein